MKIYNVAELKGALLDMAVAMCEGWTFMRLGASEHGDRVLLQVERAGHCVDRVMFAFDEINDEWTHSGPLPFYSTSWAHGGPLIERERINLWPLDRPSGVWHAYLRERDCVLSTFGNMAGSTALHAAMRSYVASRFGVELELPI